MKNSLSFHSIVRRHPREVGAVSISALFVVAAAGVFTLPWPTTHSGPTAAVRQGVIVESLTEPGTVGSSRLLLYGSTIAGVQAKIVELVPDGQVVSGGDVLVRFDATPFEQTLAREDASLREAQADLLRAREELRIEQLRSDGDLAQAREQITSAKAEVANQSDGKGRVQQAEVEAAYAEAQREVVTARTAYEDMRPLLGRGFITRSELDRAEQTWKRAEEQLRLAELRRDAMVGFERPAATARSQAALDSAEQAFTRQHESSRARLAEHEAAVRMAAGRVDEINARVALLRSQIAHTVVRSDAAGMVVYRELYFGNDRRKPQVGDEVWSSQPLMALPDTDHLTVDMRIREIDLHRVKVGAPATVRLPAYPGLELHGSIALIGALAETDASRANAKFFPLTIALDGHDARLRTGMTAEVHIPTATAPEGPIVPLQSIFEVEGRPSVFLVEHGRSIARAVTVAAENDHDAAVSNGVRVGDVVLLADPRRPAEGR
jgi:multidrug resistance efflux pump